VTVKQCHTGDTWAVSSPQWRLRYIRPLCQRSSEGRSRGGICVPF